MGRFTDNQSLPPTPRNVPGLTSTFPDHTVQTQQYPPKDDSPEVIPASYNEDTDN